MNVEDLPALEPVMRQGRNVRSARHVSFPDFLRLFEEELHGKIRGAALRPGITHVVCFENLDMWSSQFGRRVALAVGERPAGAEVPTWKLSDVLAPHFRLGDLPSQFQYPVAYASVDALRAEAPPEGRQDLAP